MVTTTSWRKSSRSSGSEGQCVEIAAADGNIAVRDSKNPGGPVLTFRHDAWASFTQNLRGLDR